MATKFSEKVAKMQEEYKSLSASKKKIDVSAARKEIGTVKIPQGLYGTLDQKTGKVFAIDMNHPAVKQRSELKGRMKRLKSQIASQKVAERIERAKQAKAVSPELQKKREERAVLKVTRKAEKKARIEARIQKLAEAKKKLD